MDQTATLLSLVAVVAAALLLVVAMRASSAGIGGSGRRPRGTPLPLPSTAKGKAPWYIEWTSFPNVTFSGGVMTVRYKAGEIGGGSGAGFRANALKKFPTDSAAMGCSIFVPSNFDFTLGGKFGPGLCIGEKQGVCATGGDWAQDSGSARVTFTEAGQAVAYVYWPEQIGKQGASYVAEVGSSTHGRTGDHLFRQTALKLRKGAWNDVGIGVTLGPPGGVGRVDLWVNGAHYSIGIKWRKSSSVRITSVLFATFFGGSTSSFAPKSDQTLQYKNFWIA